MGKPGLFTGNRNCPLPEHGFSTKKDLSAADDLRQAAIIRARFPLQKI
jgi:hypothetical protein